jgi:4-hydroxythreonine-4-phosphate dehydrogenase
MEMRVGFFSLMSDRLPVVGITMGDAAGIGPEVVVKSLFDADVRRKVRPVVVGDRTVLESACRLCRADLGFRDLGSSEKNASLIDVVDVGILENDVRTGTLSKVAGKGAGDFIVKAVNLWHQGKIDAIATAPINKESLNLGGYDFPGHTEFLASLTNTDKFAMSFFADRLRVVLLSTHLPLTEAIGKVKTTALIDLIEFADTELSKLLNKRVKIAVAGLNPHASENGKFGSEEKTEIAPAVSECIASGVDVSGPYSPDTIFLRASKGEFDVVVALYHDQATIPVKAISFGSAVNVTLGLPLIRTSVDHGTAFDIAGKGIADPSSMKAAILLAGELVAAKGQAK